MPSIHWAWSQTKSILQEHNYNIKAKNLKFQKVPICWAIKIVSYHPIHHRSAKHDLFDPLPQRV